MKYAINAEARGLETWEAFNGGLKMSRPCLVQGMKTANFMASKLINLSHEPHFLY